MALKPIAAPQLNSRMKRTADRPPTARENEIAALVKQSCKHLQEAHFEVPVKNLAHAVAAVEKMQQFLEKEGVVGADGELRISLKYYFMGINSINKICGSLGMTAMSGAKLGLMREAAALDLAGAVLAHDTENEDADDGEESAE
jgi:hypothetical protein